MDDDELFTLYSAMVAARRVDEVEQEMVRRGEAFFQVSGAGHEATAVLAAHLRECDWLHLHYRDKALLIARGFPIRGFFDGLLCNEQSSSLGRQISAHVTDREHNIISMCGPVGNATLQAVGVAAAIAEQPDHPIVLCCIGDGTTQEGEFYEACAEAARNQLPILFVVEDNRWAISTVTTDKTFYQHRSGTATDFHGVSILRADGRNVLSANSVLGAAVAEVRTERQPLIVILDVERLANHTNADDQRIYRANSEIEHGAAMGDPIVRLEELMRLRGVTAEQISALRSEAFQRVARAEQEALNSVDPVAQTSARSGVCIELTHPARERSPGIVPGGLTMKDSIKEVLRHHLQTDERVWIWGQDIEDPKGDVFGVTRGLSTQFPGRVCNAPLAEATIVGAAVGRALAGQRPVAFIQFADFLPLAFNQIASELANIYWRSGGQWQAPVIVMAPCGAYRPGLGPFHAQSMESILAHVPGLDVYLPSTASDAAGMLNAAFASARPTLFLYPKSLLNDPAQTTSNDVADQFVPIGVARKVRAGRDISFVAWGNTVRLCTRAAEALESAGVEAEVIDLRSISPWDERMVLASAERTARLLVVHEDNLTCGFGAEVLATVAEKSRLPVAMRRVTRPDTFVPCNFGNQIDLLPSFRSVLTAAADLLDLDLQWREPAAEHEDDLCVVEAVGSGPADETVTLVEYFVKAGDVVERGAPLASLEATKSVFDISAPVAGRVESFSAEPGDVIAVGRPLLSIRTAATISRRKAITQERPATPILTKRRSGVTIHLPRRDEQRRVFDVGLSPVATVTGGRIVTNDELLHSRHDMTADDIVRRTGIQERRWANGNETAINMAARACWKILDQQQLLVDDLDLIICSTTSPTSVTPSMACQVLSSLSQRQNENMLQAYDINAACSGYLYALQSGYDYLQSTPDGRVMIVTAEVLSPLLNPNDFDTSILFGDATSATILYGESHFEKATARLFRPELSAKAEDGSTLSVPLPHDGYIQMKGRRVFTEAVRSMIASLTRACERQGMMVQDLSMVVPHQANQRILDAIASRIGIEVFSNIRHFGNTSSTSIPLCLSEVLPQLDGGTRIGLCAFGGGFTFGASILQKCG